MNIQFIGLCRFSYPSDPKAFRHGQDTVEGVRAALYASDRLEQRFFYFEQVCLPALRNQTAKGFEVLVLAGENLPDTYKRRLANCTADIPQIRTVFIEEGLPHAEVCHEAMMAMRDPGADMVAEFRMDDDDAIAIDFIEIAEENLQNLGALFQQRDRLCLDFSRGYLMAFGDEGLQAALMQQRMWTPAQIFCRRPADPQSLLSANHLSAWQHMPTITHPTDIMFVRSAHTTNDSDLLSRKGYRDQLHPLDDRAKRRLRARFGIDGDQIAAVWAALNA